MSPPVGAPTLTGPQVRFLTSALRRQRRPPTSVHQSTVRPNSPAFFHGQLGQSGALKKRKKKAPTKPKGDAELPQGCSGAPKIHAAIQEVNKLKERQKEGGWPLINRRSHALRPSFPTYVCQYCSFGHFLLFIGWEPDGQVPAGPADLLHSGESGTLFSRTHTRAHDRCSHFSFDMSVTFL